MPLHTRRFLSSVSLVATTVVAVVALLVLPGWLARGGAAGPDQPRQPSPTPQDTYEVGARNWTAVDCTNHEPTCRVPVVLNLGGARFLHRSGHQQSVKQGDSSSHSLVRTVSPARGKRWILVGADRTGSDSQLSVKLGNQVAARIPSGTLSLLSVPGKRRPVQVTVADYGHSGSREVLRIEEYDSLD